MIGESLVFVTAVGCWAASASRVVGGRRLSLGSVALCVVFFCLGCALVLGLPQVYVAVDAVSNTPNLAKLLQHLTTMAALCAVGVVVFDVYTRRPLDRVRALARVGVLIAASVAMTVLFLASPVDVSEPVYFADRFSRVPLIPHYMLIFATFCGWVCLDIAMAVARDLDEVRTRSLRVGMRLIRVGAWFGLAYAGYKAAYVVATLRNVTLVPREGAISTPLALAAIGPAMVGAMLPRMTRAATGANQWRARRRQYRQLHVLWLDLYRAVPEIALHRPARLERFVVWDLNYRLYRRLIEIQDGILALLPRVEPGGDAVELASRIAHTLSGTQPAQESPSAPARHVPCVGPDAELLWLVEVVNAYRDIGAAACRPSTRRGGSPGCPGSS